MRNRATRTAVSPEVRGNQATLVLEGEVVALIQDDGLLSAQLGGAGLSTDHLQVNVRSFKVIAL